jgi:hypothetical protein
MRDWLINNIVPILAVGIVGTTLALYIVSVMCDYPVKQEVLSDMRDLCLIIVGFYFGSSKGSKEKTELLNKQRSS